MTSETFATDRNAVLNPKTERADELANHLERLIAVEKDPQRHAALCSDRAALAAAAGDIVSARIWLNRALQSDTNCEPARHNLDILEGSLMPDSFSVPSAGDIGPAPNPEKRDDNIRVAVVSFLFNWPSRGGGIVHTIELARFLGAAGFDVAHFFARYKSWEIGQVEGSLPFRSEALEFAETEWTLPNILNRFRQAVGRFAPDYVIVTDSWNIKPLLADALGSYRVIWRLQAMECLCPLNNVRLLFEPDGTSQQCSLHQLATPDDCRICLRQRGHMSGSLHQVERELCGVETPEYQTTLRRALRQAEAILVVNPLTEALVGPYARTVRVVTAGMDPDRFPWSEPAQVQPAGGVVRVAFAGLVDEWMKGFHVLQSAGELLWRRRKDFEIVATADPPGQHNAFTRFVGWMNQDHLPQFLRDSDILVMPTIAQEALGRTAVEAMAAGRPVVASRIGGLPATVLDGATGLLFDAGNVSDLALQLEKLIADPTLRDRLGRAGRMRFDEHYAWPVIIERHYKSLLKRVERPLPVSSNLATNSAFDWMKLRQAASDAFGVSSAAIDMVFRMSLGQVGAHNDEMAGGWNCADEAVIMAMLSVHRPSFAAVIEESNGPDVTNRLAKAMEDLGLNARMRRFGVKTGVGIFELEQPIANQLNRPTIFRDAVLSVEPAGVVLVLNTDEAMFIEIVQTTLTDRRGWIVCLLGCGSPPSDPGTSRKDDNVTNAMTTSNRRRQILARSFGIDDASVSSFKNAMTATHRLTIFDTPLGLAVISLG